MLPRKILYPLAILFIFYILFIQKRQNITPPPQANIVNGSAQQGLTLTDFFHRPISVMKSDTKTGDGPVALCGQKVGIKYTAELAGGKQFASSGDKVIGFTIGDGSIIKGVQQGVQGMKKGGVRKIQIPPALAYDDPKFSSKAPVPPHSNVIFNVELVDYAPAYNDKGPPLKIYDDVIGNGNALFCGETGIANYKIWDLKGNLIASTKDSEPIKIPTAKGKFPYALELALVGDGIKPAMREGEKRTVIVPPNFTKTSSGKKPDSKLLNGTELPDAVLLLEVELVGIEK